MASQNTYQQSVSFMGALTALLDIIEEVDLNDGQYLTACNALKYLHDNKNTMVAAINETSVVQEHAARARRPERHNEILTDSEKIASGRFCRCSKCDRIVGRGRANMEQHQMRKVCRGQFAAKKLAVDFNRTNVADYMNVITAIQNWGVKTGREWAWR